MRNTRVLAVPARPTVLLGCSCQAVQPPCSTISITTRLCYNIAQRSMIMSSAVVRARIDQKTKDEAAAVLASIGLTVSDAFRLMMVRIAKEKALPFELLVPNKETIAAMKEARRGGLRRHKNAKAFLKSLNADD